MSACYLKRIGRRVVLHTDSLGAALLANAPYDGVHTTLDTMSGRGVHRRFWAAGKFAALQAEAGGCIHIDGDVFIKRPELAERIERLVAENDIVFQSKDDARMYMPEVKLYGTEEEFCRGHGCWPDGEDAFNTGLLGFRNAEVKDAFAANYFEIARHMSREHKDELDRGRELTPDLIAEQLMARQWSAGQNLSTALLLGELSEAAEIGYQHVYTLEKYFMAGQCARTLEAVNRKVYEATRRLCGEPPEPEELMEGLQREVASVRNSADKPGDTNRIPR